jgi:hypothetical protein
MEKKIQIIFRVTAKERDEIFKRAKKTKGPDGRPMKVSAYIRSLILSDGTDKRG